MVLPNAGGKELKHGLRKGEVLIVANRDNALSLSALESRQAHGALVAPPFTVEAEKMGYHVLADAAFLELPTAGISATVERIEKRRQEVKAFLKATLLGIEFIKKNRTESITIMSKWLGLQPSVAARTYDLSVGNYNEDGQVPATSVKLVLDINTSAASKPTTEFAISRIIDMGPLNEVHGKK